jgi:hypothetical protein
MSMSEIKEFSIAVKATEDWIDDLQRRLDWHDRERAYQSCSTRHFTSAP